MRSQSSVNFGWRYKDDFNEAYLQPSFDDSEWPVVHLPHSTEELPLNNFDEKCYQKLTCYRKELDLKVPADDELLFIRFDGVMTFAQAYLNGTFIGEHKGGYTPFRLPIPAKLIDGEQNILAVMVDSTEREDIPPFGFVIDYLTYGGIYREVSLESVPTLHCGDILVDTADS